MDSQVPSDSVGNKSKIELTAWLEVLPGEFDPLK